MSQENNTAAGTNTGTSGGRQMVSVNGKPMGLPSENGTLNFVRPSKLGTEAVNTIVAAGIYEGTVPNNFDEEKPDYKVRAANGDLTIINTCASLAKQFEKVRPGSYVELTYLGKKKIEDGKYKGKESHSFVVAIDASDLAAGE